MAPNTTSTAWLMAAGVLTVDRSKRLNLQLANNECLPV